MHLPTLVYSKLLTFLHEKNKEATKTGLGKISGIIIVTPSTFDSFKNFKRGKMRLKSGGGAHRDSFQRTNPVRTHLYPLTIVKDMK